jgi:hypothetical protein
VPGKKGYVGNIFNVDFVMIFNKTMAKIAPMMLLSQIGVPIKEKWEVSRRLVFPPR